MIQYLRRQNLLCVLFWFQVDHVCMYVLVYCTVTHVEQLLQFYKNAHLLKV